MAESPAAALRRLEKLRTEYGDGAAARKLVLLERLERADLPDAAHVARLHEVICYLRAYPDDPAVLDRVETMAERFARRRDLRRHADELIDTGIPGTATYYSFFARTAEWLAERWPDRLHVDWTLCDCEELLADRLPLITRYSESLGLDEEDRTVRGWIERLKGPREGDGAFLARRFAALAGDAFVRERVYEELDLMLRLDPGPDTPARARERAAVAGARTHFQDGPLDRARPDLRTVAYERPRRVRALPPRQGRAVLDLARAAMVARSRDLDVFAYGDPRDVRLVEWEDGLSFAAIGFLPERRLMLEAVYGFLTLKNGVPIGYVLNSALFGSAEIAYNVFETWRGAEAGRVYGRVIATVRHLFGSDSFTIYPYQLGDGNEEALASGAWWFYKKLGFRPRDRGALRTMRAELRKMKRDPGHRSSKATLRELAEHNVYLHLGDERDDVIGMVDAGRIGLRVIDLYAERFGAGREKGERILAREARERFGVRTTRGWSADERRAWARWSPLLVLLEGVERWTPAERRATVKVVRAKGGRHESDFARAFDRHEKLRAAVLALAR